jgi:hypothetical protein
MKHFPTSSVRSRALLLVVQSHREPSSSTTMRKSSVSDAMRLSRPEPRSQEHPQNLASLASPITVQQYVSHASQLPAFRIRANTIAATDHNVLSGLVKPAQVTHRTSALKQQWLPTTSPSRTTWSRSTTQWVLGNAGIEVVCSGTTTGIKPPVSGAAMRSHTRYLLRRLVSSCDQPCGEVDLESVIDTGQFWVCAWHSLLTQMALLWALLSLIEKKAWT